MAKRSDFAQKLLDDLRVRKERMAAPAQSSNRSNAMAIDAYAYSKQTYRGSRDTKTHGITSSRNGNPQSRSTGSSRTPIRQEASNQMVAYGRGGNSGQIVDLSMALAFALENGATKLTRTSSSSKSSVMRFMNQIGRGSMDFIKLERKGNVNMYWGSSSQFPNLSNFHIEEISRGAQKSEAMPSDYAETWNSSTSQPEASRPQLFDAYATNNYVNGSGCYQTHGGLQASLYRSYSGKRGDEGDCTGQQRGSMCSNQGSQRCLAIQ